MFPGTVAIKILDEIMPMITKNLGPIKRSILDKEMTNFKEYLITLTPGEQEEVKVALLKIKEILNKEI